MVSPFFLFKNFNINNLIITTMCKFTAPAIPTTATPDERRAIYFDALKSLDLSDKTEKRDNLSYLSWANAWGEFKAAYPSATYRIVKNPQTQLPYFVDPETGILVFTEVSVDGITHEMWLPVMNGANKAMKLEPYNYQAWDSYKKAYVEKTVNAASMFDINKTIMRCLVKNLAMFGLGLYIYAGDDLPEKSTMEDLPETTPQKPVDKYAGIKTAINSAKDITALMTLYLDHQNEVEGNTEIKALLTERKMQLQNNPKQ